MTECRYFPECQRCNEVGDSWLPCAGGADGIRCNGYEPMPDVKALFELANEMVAIAGAYPKKGSTSPLLLRFARRIREACGEAVA